MNTGTTARLVLTDEGRKLLTHAYPIIEAFNHDSFAALTSTGRADLSWLLRKPIDSRGQERLPPATALRARGVVDPYDLDGPLPEVGDGLAVRLALTAADALLTSDPATAATHAEPEPTLF